MSNDPPIPLTLLPCPFTGQKAFCENREGKWVIGCMYDLCGFDLVAAYPDKEQAIKAWNTRAYSTPDSSSADCREAFEKWARQFEYKYTFSRRSDGLYESSHTHIMWEAFQAAWDARARSTPDREDSQLELENRQLRDALEHYRHADDGVYRMLAGFSARPDMRDPNSIAGKALENASEHPDNAEQPPPRAEREVK